MKFKQICPALGCLFMLSALPFASASFAADISVTQKPDEAAIPWAHCGGAWPEKGCEAALAWGDWEKGTSGFWVRAPKGHKFVRHAHPTPERILMVRGQIVGGVDGGKEIRVAPGTYWGLDANVVHWARCEDACLMYITYDSPYGLSFP